VSIYGESREEALRARRLLKDWAGEGFLTPEQYQRMEKETACDLRTTNIFLRAVLFLFTVLVVGAAAALFFSVFASRPSQQTMGVLLLIFAAVTYAAAELAVSQGRLYRYGIEEAFAVCSVGFLCVGMQFALFSGGSFSSNPGVRCLVPAAGAAFSLWIWRRFGLAYAFLAAMIFIVFLPGYWTSSHPAQRLIIVGFYVAGLIVVAAARSRHRFDYLDDTWSFVEAALWLGIYLTINLQLSLDLPERWGVAQAAAEFPAPFYWTTWVLIWCLPPIVLARGVLRKDRFVIAVGAIIAILTLISNKPYLGWPRHTWDPMLLGALLIGVALLVRRWLARGPGGIRHGFTAERLSGKHKEWMDAGSVAAGLVAHETIAPVPQPGAPEFRFGGGESGGGGASGDF
jgi:hypothetical protein